MDLSTLANAEILRGLTDEELAELGAIASEQDFERRDRLFTRGERAEAFYIATRGRFALTVSLRFFDSHTEIPIEELMPLDAFGWSSLVEPRTSIYSCYCLEDGAAVAFPTDRLEPLITTDWCLGAKLRRNLNELIGARVRVVQGLWLDEVSQSMSRMQHWFHTELTNRWSAAMTESGSSANPVTHWFRRFTRTEIND